MQDFDSIYKVTDNPINLFSKNPLNVNDVPQSYNPINKKWNTKLNILDRPYLRSKNKIIDSIFKSYLYHSISVYTCTTCSFLLTFEYFSQNKVGKM